MNDHIVDFAVRLPLGIIGTTFAAITPEAWASIAAGTATALYFFVATIKNLKK